MNKALIGKQAWRIISQLGSIVISFFIPKYCKKKQFTKVKPQPSCSWIWKSILTDIDVILKGIDVQVRNGFYLTISDGILEKRDNTSINNT